MTNQSNLLEQIECLITFLVNMKLYQTEYEMYF